MLDQGPLPGCGIGGTTRWSWRIVATLRIRHTKTVWASAGISVIGWIWADIEKGPRSRTDSGFAQQSGMIRKLALRVSD